MMMKSILSSPRYIFLSTLFAWLIASILLYTGWLKISDTYTFQQELLINGLSNRSARMLAYSVPTIELLIAIILLVPKGRKWGFALSGMLFILFTLYLILITTEAGNIACACGGFIGRMPYWLHIFFNSTLVLLSIIGFLQSNSSKEMSHA